ncbi:MAG TPA: sialidase family protein [Candidatus Dormibacteraeota bacterium]|nr:sialidase family protein [Candidatus Dormibacteraeota bacterium]
MRRTVVLAAITALLAAISVQPVHANSRGGIQLSSARDQAAVLRQEQVGGPFNSICAASRPFGSNFMANCDSTVLPHNETAIVADPNDPRHLVGGSNNSQVLNNPGHSAMGYYTSFDGGATWTNGQVPTGAFAIASDPTVGFDTTGNVFFGTVAFDLGLGGTALGGAIQVSRSRDGGRTFETPVQVERSTSDGIVEDKEYLSVDTNPGSPFLNSIYITWTRFHFDSSDTYLESPIFFSASRDGGATWSLPKEISGTNTALCTFSGTPLPFDGRCKEDQFSTPVVAPDGAIVVAFENEQAINDGQFRDQYLVVRSTDGGATWGRPVRASDILHDGVGDYPINVVGRQTLSNSQFRVNSAGNLAVDPSGGNLVVVWSDNRNGTAANTNTDIFLVRSADGGATWSSPVVVTNRTGDQFYPWAAFGPDGSLNVSFFDRSYDPANSQYGITLARQRPGHQILLQQVDTGLSDPNHARWFASATGGKTIFLGDYNGLAVASDGVAHPMWTDMRRVVTVSELSGHTEDVFTASVQ